MVVRSEQTSNCVGKQCASDILSRFHRSVRTMFISGRANEYRTTYHVNMKTKINMLFESIVLSLQPIQIDGKTGNYRGKSERMSPHGVRSHSNTMDALANNGMHSRVLHNRAIHTGTGAGWGERVISNRTINIGEREPFGVHEPNTIYFYITNHIRCSDVEKFRWKIDLPLNLSRIVHSE